MAKLTLNDLANLSSETAAVNSINNNSALIEIAMEKTLSRDGTSPNEMNSTLDMNSFRIINLPAATSANEPVRKAEFDQVVIEATAGITPDGTVTTVKLADDAVTQVKMADDSVGTAELINDNVTNAKLANMATQTFKGRTTAGTGDPEDLTATQATAMLNTFVGSGASHAKGLVPSPGSTAGILRFLREDATWETPSTGSGSVFYNAVTDGGVDNTGTANASTIQAAIAAAAAANKPIYFPAGTYEVDTGMVTISANNVRIVCEGNKTVFRRSSNTATPIFRVDGTNFTMEYGKFLYNNVNSTVDGYHCALYMAGARSTLKDVHVAGIFYVGIYHISSGIVENCYVQGVVNRSYYFATASGITDNYMAYKNCVANGAQTEGGSTKYTNYGFNTNAFGTGSAAYVFLDSCKAVYCSTHAYGFSDRIQFTQVSNCMASDISGPGFLIQKANGFAVGRVNLSNCQALRCSTGFYCIDSVYVNMSNCIATLSTGNGFLIQGGAYTALANCISENNSASGFYVADGTSGSFGTTFNGCIAAANASFGFVSVAGSSYVTVVGCQALVNTSGSYSISGANLATTGNL